MATGVPRNNNAMIDQQLKMEKENIKKYFKMNKLLVVHTNYNT
jgi:hypothetical protein